MENIIIILVVSVIVIAAVAYIYKEKKRGVKCIGCPSGGGCASGCSGNCSSCGSNAEAR